MGERPADESADVMPAARAKAVAETGGAGRAFRKRRKCGGEDQRREQGGKEPAANAEKACAAS